MADLPLSTWNEMKNAFTEGFFTNEEMVERLNKFDSIPEEAQSFIDTGTISDKQLRDPEYQKKKQEFFDGTISKDELKGFVQGFGDNVQSFEAKEFLATDQIEGKAEFDAAKTESARQQDIEKTSQEKRSATTSEELATLFAGREPSDIATDPDFLKFPQEVRDGALKIVRGKTLTGAAATAGEAADLAEEKFADELNQARSIIDESAERQKAIVKENFDNAISILQSNKTLNEDSKTRLMGLANDFKDESNKIIDKKASLISESFGLRKAIKESQLAAQGASVSNVFRTRGLDNPLVLSRLTNQATQKFQQELDALRAEELDKLTGIQDELRVVAGQTFGSLETTERNFLTQAFSNNTNLANLEVAKAKTELGVEQGQVADLVKLESAEASLQAQKAQEGRATAQDLGTLEARGEEAIRVAKASKPPVPTTTGLGDLLGGIGDRDEVETPDVVTPGITTPEVAAPTDAELAKKAEEEKKRKAAEEEAARRASPGSRIDISNPFDKGLPTGGVLKTQV